MAKKAAVKVDPVFDWAVCDNMGHVLGPDVVEGPFSETTAEAIGRLEEAAQATPGKKLTLCKLVPVKQCEVKAITTDFSP